MSSSSSSAAALFVCLAASVVEFATTADKCTSEDVYGQESSCTDHKIAWALACGVVSTFFCIIGLVLIKAAPNRPAFTDLFLSLILVGIWIFGAAFNTSTNGTYNLTGNGYFSTWIALLGAAYYAHLSLGHLREHLERHVRFNGPILVLVASVVEFSVAADYYANIEGAKDNSRAEWAIAVGCVSFFLCALQLLFAYLHSGFVEVSGKILSLLLVAMWAAGAGVNTSVKGPFNQVSNGYFFSWFAFGASIFYAISVWSPEGTASFDDDTKYQSMPSGGSTGTGPVVTDVPPPVQSAGGPGYQTLE